MSPFWQNIDLLPSAIREKAQEKPLRSPKEVAGERLKFQEGLRESEERQENERVTAEVLHYIEMNEEELKEKMSNEKLEDALADFSSYDTKKWGQMQQAFAKGNFDLSVDANEDGNPRIFMSLDLPEGNIQEKILLNEEFQEKLVKRATDSTKQQ